MEKNGEHFMADLSGDVRVFKRLRRHAVWRRDPACYGRAWVDLLLLAVDAASAPQKVYVQGTEIVLERGQVGWSQSRLAEEWNRSREWVIQFLKWCQDQGMIMLETTARGTVITILNYDAYQTAEPTTDLATGQTAEPTTQPPANPATDPTHKGKGERERVNGKGERPAPVSVPQGGPGGPTAVPSDDEVGAFCAGFQDLARGIVGIPEGWWRGWLANLLQSTRPWPGDWQRALKNAFLGDWAARHPKAVGPGPGSGARGAGQESPKNAGKTGGRTMGQLRFELSRELEAIRERLDACHETAVQPAPADVAREREIEKEIADLEKGVQTDGRE